MPMDWPEERYSIDVIIQDYNVPTVVNANEKYSIITTGLLKLLNTRGCYIKFYRGFIVLSGEYFESLGIINNLAIALEHMLIEPTLHVIKNDYPCLVFGQDWFKQYKARYNSTKTKLRFCYYRNQKAYIPIIKLEEELKNYNEASPSNDEEKELFINTNINCDQTKVKEEFLIDLSEDEDNTISQQKDKPLISSDIFKLDVEKF